MGQPNPVDPRELLERLRRQHDTLRWEPLLPSDDLYRLQERPMREEASLAYLHRNWSLPDSFSARTSGGGMKDRIARRLGGLVFRTMGSYLHAERELIANLVRMNDALAIRCDELTNVVAERQRADAENQAKLAALVYTSIDRPDGRSGNGGGHENSNPLTRT